VALVSLLTEIARLRIVIGMAPAGLPAYPTGFG
jgi:hypothetical protein